MKTKIYKGKQSMVVMTCDLERFETLGWSSSPPPKARAAKKKAAKK